MTTNHISDTTADKNRQNWCTPNRYVMRSPKVQGIKPLFSCISKTDLSFLSTPESRWTLSIYVHLSGRFLWDCTCRGLGPWTPCRCRRRATECSTSATKPSDPGWRRRRGRSHVSTDVEIGHWNPKFSSGQHVKSQAESCCEWKDISLLLSVQNFQKKLSNFHFAYPCPEYSITLRNVLKEILWHLHLIYIYVKNPN